MANSIGIDVKVKLPSQKDLESQLKEKWGGVKKSTELKVRVGVDGNSLASMNKKIRTYLEGKKYNIKVRMDVMEATKDIHKIGREYVRLKEQVEKGIKLKFQDSDFSSGLNGTMKSGTKTLSSINKANDNYIKQTMKNAKYLSDGVGVSVKNSVKDANGVMREIETITKRINAFQKEVSVAVDGKKIKTDTVKDKAEGLKEIIRLTRDIGRLEAENVTVSSGVAKANNRVIDVMKSQLNSLKDEYKNVFNQDANKEFAVKEAGALAKLQVELMNAVKAKSDMAQKDKEAADNISQLMKLEKERYSHLSKAEKAGDNARKLHENEALEIEKSANALKTKLQLTGQITKEQELAYNTLRSQNEAAIAFQSKLQQAKSQDKAQINVQRSNLRELQNELKSVAKLQQSINGLEEKKKNGVLTSKDNDNLSMLKNELAVRKQIIEQIRKTANKDGGLSKEGKEAISNLEKQLANRKRISDEADKERAKIAKSNSDYKKIEDSIKKVYSLKKRALSAGENEKAVIEEQISKEKEYQAAIKKRISLMKNVNTEREKEIAKTRRSAEEEYQNAKKIKDAKNKDSELSRQPEARGRERIWAVDPIRLANTAKRAFMGIYNSVAQVDSAIVDIQKVADVPQEVLDKFSVGLYDQATKVGKSAEEYGNAVARWLTTGKTLHESNELAEISVMGGFVGNIEESDMVKYMAVPLNAYKKDLLEATDIINAMNEVSNNNAVEMEHLGEAYSRAAATASTAGTSFDELTGMITAAQSATYAGGEKIGTAIRAMDMNVGKIAAGKSKGDQQKFDFLKEIGVELKDQEGRMRSTYEVMGDLAKVWDELSEENQTTATMHLAGKNHSAIAQSIVKNWDTVLKAQQEARGQIDLLDKENGSAFKEFESQTDSIQYKAQALKNSFAELLHTIAGGRNGVNGVLESLTKLVEKGTELAQNKKFMGLAKNAGKFLLFKGATDGIGKMFDVGSRKLLLLDKTFMSLKKTSKLLTAGKAAAGVASTTSALSGLGSALGIVAPLLGLIPPVLMALELSGVDVIGGLGKAFDAIINPVSDAEKAVRKFKKANDESKKSIKEGMQKLDEARRMDELINKYHELAKAKEEARAEHNQRVDEGSGEEKKDRLWFDDDEFKAVKKDFNDLAKDLGFDIKITFNDYDDIEEKYNKLREMQKQAERDGVKKISKGLEKASKYPKLEENTQLKFEKSKNYKYKGVEKWQKQFGVGKESMMYNKTAMNDPHRLESDKKQAAERYYEEIAKYRLQFLNREKQGINLYNKETRKIEKEARKQKKEFFSKDGFVGKMGTLAKDDNLPAYIDEGSAKALAMNIPALKEEEKIRAGIVQKMEAKKDLSEADIKYLSTVDKKFANMATNHERYGESQEEITKLLNEQGQAAEGVKNRIKDAYMASAEAQGISRQEAEKNLKALEGTKAEVIDLMASWGDMGASFLGISNLFKNMFPEDWGERFKALQSTFDGLSDDKKKLAVELEFVDSDGYVDTGKLDSIYGLPDIMKKSLKLWVDDEVNGTIDMAGALDLVEKLNEVDNPEIRAILGVDDNDATLTIDDFVKNLDKLSTDQLYEVMIKTNVDQNSLLYELSNADMEFDVEAHLTTDQAKADYAAFVAAMTGSEAIPLKAQLEVLANNKNAPEKMKEEIQQVLSSGAPLTVDVVQKFAKKLSPDAEINDSYEQKIKVVTEGLPEAKAEIDGAFEDTKVNIEVKADTEAAENNLINLESARKEADGKKAKVKGVAHTDEAKGKVDALSASVDSVPRSRTITFTVVTSKIPDIVKGGKSASVALNLRAGNTASVVSSVGYGIASSLSQSVGSALKTGQSKATGKSQSKGSSGKPKRVESDAWRYWSQELFTGLPLERSMDKLRNSINDAKDNQDKLIGLYGQQINLIKQQISHEESMRKAKQNELNEVLSALRKEGFKTSGNKVTNLGHAKNISGDERVDKVNESLSKYKSLYTEINSINGKILTLQQEQKKINDDIKNAKIAKELKSIEGRLAKTERLMTAISNHTDIMSKKLGFLDSGDFEMGLTFNEEAMNRSNESVSKLLQEFNKLSTMKVDYEDNAKVIQSKLETLKTQIISNSDAALQYAAAIKEIEINRLSHDIDALSDSLDKNTARITKNVDTLQEGLLSGTTFGDLESSKFANLDLSRKSKLENEYAERLRLEAELNEAMDGYARKNVERTAKVSDTILTVTHERYKKLLNMQSEYSNGKIGDITSYLPEQQVGKHSSEKDKSYNQWTKNLEKVNNEYAKAYSEMAKKYDMYMSKAKDGAEREKISHDFILSQLELQEDIYNKLIVANKEAAGHALDMLSSTGLSTSQIKAIESELDKYQENIIQAQDNIRDTVKKRYDFEFEKIDKLMSKSEKYTSSLEHLLAIQEAVGNDESARGKIVDAMLDSKINEYGVARKALSDLLAAQSKVTEGSFEWNLLDEKISDVDRTVKELTLSVLNANKELMNSKINTFTEAFQKGIFDGKTQKDWEDYRDKWMTGVSKELELNRLREKMLELESDIYKDKIEAMDRQEAISKRDVEYLDKQLDLLELQEKLQNLNAERNVQTLIQNDDGTWDWGYVANQTEIDKVKEDIQKAEMDLEDFRDTQRKSYMDDVNNVLEKAQSGKYSNTNDLKSDLEAINSAYDYILKDIPDLDIGNMDEILSIYQDYLNKNQDIVSNIGNDRLDEDKILEINNISTGFEQGFRSVATELENLISESIKKALEVRELNSNSKVYHIEKQVLEFPNVKDTTGFEEVLIDLPNLAKQTNYEK